MSSCWRWWTKGVNSALIPWFLSWRSGKINGINAGHIKHESSLGGNIINLILDIQRFYPLAKREEKQRWEREKRNQVDYEKEEDLCDRWKLSNAGEHFSLMKKGNKRLKITGKSSRGEWKDFKIKEVALIFSWRK